ncbi:hypothetical protein BDV35DRAFT_298830 [Aspergillus flavus]|uniref:DNA, SC010 n=3 Tax=Aspergillus subgen. Circumdati TaxID=2720871 RepID=Q2TW72_ASPOR|nr:unnamed protein product [Aspergillus oryzae RIB40]EIT75741.1 hypothetical protein Ao3042_08193 [Aspergillus oryzae 3.042]KAB8244199.1 hypothetical protein BDV35DRAFT_298830 [Aspergillus flavus]KDE84257.1 hypothetical protein AO1008_10855 [Aspergillus oryzae 100-8]GMF71708.1 unnamed protein product [Aspergillus oryzae]KAJ1715482.1 hypothetical protein NYO67_2396 [Aspergillus flavus]|eukprot:EIT75741.1 hypothetical protein Ao3042_08193 [Aspergillus oryzae 3.042]
MGLTIHTVGTSTLHRQAERAVIYLDVSSDGSDQSTVSQDVTRTSNRLQSLLKEIAPKQDSGDPTPEAPVTFWSMSSISTGSYLPWDHDKQEHRARVYTARTNFEVKFRDFSKLGEFVSDVAKDPLVSVRDVDWQLTDDTKQQLGQECRKLAVWDALAKAKDYAGALNMSNLRPVEIDDSEGHVSPGIYASARRAPAFAESGGEQALNFVPQSCEIECSVKMRLEVE